MLRALPSLFAHWQLSSRASVTILVGAQRHRAHLRAAYNEYRARSWAVLRNLATENTVDWSQYTAQNAETALVVFHSNRHAVM